MRLNTALWLARERERLTVIDDQHGSPTGEDLLADVTAHALRIVLPGAGQAGIYHVAAGETTWNGHARFVLSKAQQAGQDLKAGPEQVDLVPTSSFPTAARRPHNSKLDTSRFRRTFGLTLPPWQQGVARML
jgi:dTDP-4-dehydrorhamnose reductase